MLNVTPGKLLQLTPKWRNPYNAEDLGMPVHVWNTMQILKGILLVLNVVPKDDEFIICFLLPNEVVVNLEYSHEQMKNLNNLFENVET